jgi:hypothetical protein
MGSGTADVWVCDYADCGHVWLVGECVPQRCAKCHRRGWNSKRGAVEESEPAQVVVEQTAQVEAPEPARQPDPEPRRAPVFDLPTMAQVNTTARPAHDPKTCRVYRCGACLKLAHHDTKRGL